MDFDTCTAILGPLCVGLAISTITLGIRAHNAKTDAKRAVAAVEEIKKEKAKDSAQFEHVGNQVSAYYDEERKRDKNDVKIYESILHRVLDYWEESLAREDQYAGWIRDLTKRYRQ